VSAVVVFGGGGFLGQQLVDRLTAEGMTVCVAVRHPERARLALRAIDSDRVTVLKADVRDARSVAEAVAGADAVVNAVSAYVEKGGVTFEAVHEKGAETIARESAAADVSRLILVSGIGADPQSTSRYIRARGRGECLVREAFTGATIARPSAMFGPGDGLFNTVAGLARVLPALPLIGGGHTRVQPVFVEDVAAAIAAMLFDPGTVGQTYELAGPKVYTLRDLTKMALRFAGKRRPLFSLPLAIAEVQARAFEFLPNPPLTTSQVDLLKSDNVASGKLPGFEQLAIQPRSVEAVVPTYIKAEA